MMRARELRPPEIVDLLIVVSLAALTCVRSVGASSPPAWQVAMERGREQAKRREWKAAVEYYTAAVQQAPDQAAPRIERGNAYGELGLFAKSREDFQRVAELDPKNPEPWYRTALVCIALNDEAGYKRACDELLARFAKTNDPRVASPLAYTCVALPGAVDTSDVLIHWGEVATPLFQGNERVLGAALYRAGRYDEAVRKLEQSARLTTPVAWDWLFLAMSYCRLGHVAQARDNLTKARCWIRAADANRGNKPGATRTSWHSWNERAEVRALQREAETLLGAHP